MVVEGSGVELREHEDAPDPAVETVADGNVDETVLASERHGGLGAVRGKSRAPVPPPRIRASVLSGTARSSYH